MRNAYALIGLGFLVIFIGAYIAFKYADPTEAVPPAQLEANP